MIGICVPACALCNEGDDGKRGWRQAERLAAFIFMVGSFLGDKKIRKKKKEEKEKKEGLPLIF